MKCTEGRDVAWKLETWNRQLQIGICKVHDGIEQGSSTTARRPWSARIDLGDRPPADK